MSKKIFEQWAPQYADLGYEVLAVRPKAKRPIPKNGCSAATTEETQIIQWTEQYPNANIGIKAGDSILIIDVDNKKDKTGVNDILEIIKDLGPLPKRPTVETPTGGCHLYFKHPGIGIKAQAGVKWKGQPTGIDIRVGNSYVVAPPSIHPEGGEYKWSEDNPLVPIENLPELPQSWIEGFLPLRDAPAENKPIKSDTTTTPEPPSGVFPLVVENVIERKAIKYLETCPRAVQGKNGHNTLLSIAIALVQGFKLVSVPRSASSVDSACTRYKRSSDQNAEKKR